MSRKEKKDKLEKDREADSPSVPTTKSKKNLIRDAKDNFEDKLTQSWQEKALHESSDLNVLKSDEEKEPIKAKSSSISTKALEKLHSTISSGSFLDKKDYSTTLESEEEREAKKDKSSSISAKARDRFSTMDFHLHKPTFDISVNKIRDDLEELMEPYLSKDGKQPKQKTKKLTSQPLLLNDTDRLKQHLNSLFAFLKALIDDRQYLKKHHQLQATTEIAPSLTALNILDEIIKITGNIIEGTMDPLNSLFFPDRESHSELDVAEDQLHVPESKREKPVIIIGSMEAMDEKIANESANFDGAEVTNFRSSDSVMSSNFGTEKSQSFTTDENSHSSSLLAERHLAIRQERGARETSDSMNDSSFSESSHSSSLLGASFPRSRSTSQSVTTTLSSESNSSFTESETDSSMTTSGGGPIRRSSKEKKNSRIKMLNSPRINAMTKSTRTARQKSNNSGDGSEISGVQHSYSEGSLRKTGDKKPFYDSMTSKLGRTSKRADKTELIPPLLISSPPAIPDLAAFKEMKRRDNVKLILSLDGGGIRGMATIEFLKYLEMALGQPLNDVFDLVCGSSVGSILAGMIAGMEWTANHTHSLFRTKELYRGIFPPTNANFALNGPKYGAGKGKANVIRKYFGDKKMTEVKTHLLISSYDITAQTPLIFTENSDRVSLADAVNASTAAPTYFPPVEIFPGKWCIDGGVVASDLSMYAYAEASRIWEGSEIKILSVGTGITSNFTVNGEEAKSYGLIGWFTRGDLFATLTSSSNAIVQQEAEILLGKNYLRVNSYTSHYGVKSELDNTSSHNMANLMRMGQAWYKDFRDAAINLIVPQSIATLDPLISSVPVSPISTNPGTPRGSSQGLSLLSDPTSLGELGNTSTVTNASVTPEYEPGDVSPRAKSLFSSLANSTQSVTQSTEEGEDSAPAKRLTGTG